MILNYDMTCEIIAFPILYQYRPAVPPRHPVSRNEQRYRYPIGRRESPRASESAITYAIGSQLK